MHGMDERHRASSDAAAIEESLEAPGSFAVVFDRHYDAIWGYLCRRAGAAIADELAGETFLRAFATRARYDPARGDAGPWLYGIATNLLRRHARTELRRRRAYARAAEPENVDDGFERADARLDAVARLSAAAAALERLSAADRETLLLFALSELDYAGIAIATGVPVGTVRSRLHRARREIRLELGLEPIPGAEERISEESS
jgi:RNA polymerase sigma factor (sigma-70 family)